MNIIEAISNPGSLAKNNEDIWGSSGYAVWVFDGATGLSPDQLVAKDGQTDPRWLVEQADKSLKANADKIEDMHGLYARVLADCERAFHAEARRMPTAPWELPMAASLVVRMFNKRVICGALSDCTLLIETSDGDVDIMPPCTRHADIDANTKIKMLEAVESGLSPDEARARLIPHLQNNRKLANSMNGYDVFAPEAHLADRVRIRMFEPKEGGHALLMSDGVYALVENYKRYDDYGLMQAAKTKGLDALYKELREIEEEDSGLHRFPRFKKSDDATAVLVGF